MMDADDVAVLAEDFDPAEIPLVTQSGPLPRESCVAATNPPTGRPGNWSVTGSTSATEVFCTNSSKDRPKAIPRGRCRDFHIIAGVEGNRSRDPNKYGEDAALLERTLETEKDPFPNSRYTFYGAQSLRDAGEYAQGAGGLSSARGAWVLD